MLLVAAEQPGHGGLSISGTKIYVLDRLYTKVNVYSITTV